MNREQRRATARHRTNGPVVMRLTVHRTSDGQYDGDVWVTNEHLIDYELLADRLEQNARDLRELAR